MFEYYVELLVFLSQKDNKLVHILSKLINFICKTVMWSGDGKRWWSCALDWIDWSGWSPPQSTHSLGTNKLLGHPNEIFGVVRLLALTFSLCINKGCMYV